MLTGTIFHGTKIPVRTWIFVVFEMASSKNGVAAREIERKYDLTAKSAWFMVHRIREAMKREPMAGLLTGRVVVDETYVGGKPGNRHVGRRGRKGYTDKTPVVALVSRETGEVRARVIPNITGANLWQTLTDETDPETTELHTDESVFYPAIARHFAGHETVNHSDGEYSRGDVSTNHVEGFFSQLKRSIDGTHHHVSVDHLHRYVTEFAFRYTFRKESDAARMARIVGQTKGRRLAYRQPAPGASGA